MAQSKGSNINLIKSHNLSAILLRLLQDGALSRVELAKKLDLSNTTITNLAGELLEAGIIHEEDGDNHSQHKRVGRPRTMLDLVPTARYAIGVHIGIGLIRVAVTDLYAEIICNAMDHFALGTKPEIIVGQIVTLIRQVLAESNIDQARVIGVGVGASGLVNPHTGVNVLATRLGWQDVPLAEMLAAQLDFPICIDNNVRAMALAEALFGCGRQVSVLAFVYGRVGVGAGFVVNGQLFRGSGAGAGEIGHTVMVPQGGQQCTCGNHGCLETLISETVLVEEALKLAERQPDSLLNQYLRSNQFDKPMDAVFAAARAGDQASLELLHERACYLGIALANLVNVLNPELIILGGLFAQGEDLLLPIAETKMRATAFGGLGSKVRLQTTQFGWRAGVTGAAALALTNFFYQQPEGN
ncbi:MAG: ROK family transcriptional regulator [Anaerolineales bacterium]|nr:ROK family transcriptional regulator [Anaerolineales bacterium]